MKIGHPLDHYNGTIFRLVAHYPLIKDKEEHWYTSLKEALTAATTHRKNGANVEIAEAHWREIITPTHWLTVL